MIKLEGTKFFRRTRTSIRIYWVSTFFTLLAVVYIHKCECIYMRMLRYVVRIGNSIFFFFFLKCKDNLASTEIMRRAITFTRAFPLPRFLTFYVQVYYVKRFSSFLFNKEKTI